MLLGIEAEKEGNYAREKRVDIKVLFKQMNIPIEIKRHYHPDVWSALNEQLIKKYTIDPGAQGWGIYLVLWFGKEIKKIPKPPNGISKPESLNELKEALMNMIPSEVYNQIEIICIDCSSPKA